MNPVDPIQQTAMAVGRIPSGLFILTARDGERETGMLASWVQQCSFEPLQVTVAVRRDRPVAAWLIQGVPVTLNQIGEGQNSLISHFGKGFAPDEPAFSGLNVERRSGEAPILREALAHLLCRISGVISAGDHEVFIATVIGGEHQIPEGKPMVHIRKSGLRY